MLSYILVYHLEGVLSRGEENIDVSPPLVLSCIKCYIDLPSMEGAYCKQIPVKEHIVTFSPSVFWASVGWKPNPYPKGSQPHPLLTCQRSCWRLTNGFGWGLRPLFLLLIYCHILYTAHLYFFLCLPSSVSELRLIHSERDVKSEMCW